MSRGLGIGIEYAILLCAAPRKERADSVIPRRLYDVHADVQRQSTQQQLEAFWLTKVYDSRRRYLDAVEQSRRIGNEVTRRRNNEQAIQDTVAFVEARARRVEAWALAEYEQAINTYTDLVVYAVVPPEVDDLW
jgi:hypothetical protein